MLDTIYPNSGLFLKGREKRSMEEITNKKIMKELGICLIVLLCTFFIAFVSPLFMEKYRTSPSYFQTFVRGTVLEIVENNLEKDSYVKGRYRGTQVLKIRLDEGEYKERVFEIQNTLDSLRSAVGFEGLHAIFTVRTEADGEINVWLYNYNRNWGVYLIIILFAVLVISIGKKEGIRSLLALIFTAAVIFYFVVPGMWTPFPIPIAIFSSLLICSVTFLLIAGTTKKALVATLGTVSGIILAGLICYLMGHFMNLSGIDMEKGSTLIYLAQDRNFQVKDILFVSILISSLGATMDIAITLASSGEQLQIAKPNMEKREYYAALMAVGKDAIGTMTNTLILAFCGTSLPLAMMIWGYKMEYLQMINIPVIVINILQAFSGSIGMVASVFFTAVISTIFFMRRKTYEKN